MNPILETERLYLRKPIMEDAPAIFSRYATDPEVTCYVSWLPHSGVEVTRKIVGELFIPQWEAGSDFVYAIIEKVPTFLWARLVFIKKDHILLKLDMCWQKKMYSIIK